MLARARRARSSETGRPVSSRDAGIVRPPLRGSPRDENDRDASIRLDLSEGPEPVVIVEVQGWDLDRKQEFLSRTERRRGVVEVRPAGGFSSLHVRYAPDEVTADSLIEWLTALSRELASPGERVRTEVVRPTPYSEAKSIFPPSVGVTPPPSSGTDARHSSSAWTGVLSGAQRLYTVKSMFPSALAAVEAIIFDLEHAGSNGGPPLDNKGEALEALKGFRDALSAILDLADKDDLESGICADFLGDAIRFAHRAHRMLAADPVKCGVVGMGVALAEMFGGNGLAAGAMAAVGAVGAMVPYRNE